jgi:propionyl-CoA synthetase
VVGHSYIVYGPLLHGCTTVLFEGKPVGTPDAGAFWRVVASTRRSCSSPRRPRSAPSRRRTRRALLPSSYDLSSFRACSSPASAPTRRPSNGPRRNAGVPVIDHWWQTETGWPIAGNPVGLGRCR